MRRAAIAAGLLGVLMTAGARAEPRRVLADPFQACRERLLKAPDDYDSAYCFYAATFAARLWDEGARVFDALMRDRPGNFWLPLALGHLHRNRQPADLDAAVEWYRRSAEGFRASGHAEGEILARSNLRDLLLPMGRVADASAEMARVAALGVSADDPLLKARAWSLEAAHLFDTGGDLGLAGRLLKQAEQAVFPDGPYRLRRNVLNSLGRVYLRLGRLDEAAIHFGRLAEQARAENDLASQATAQYNLLNTESMRESLLPTPGAKERLLRLARHTLEVGRAASNTQVTLKAHRVVAALLSNNRETGSEALEHLERCLALAKDARRQQDEAACAWMVAILLHATAPRQAEAAHRQALRATAGADTPVAEALDAGRRMQFSWLTRPRPEAIRDSLEALDVLETLRSLQDGPDSTAAVFSTWTLDYYWLSGRLLLDGTGDVDLAFSVAERLRARTLLEARERARTPTDPQQPAVVERRTVRREIAAIQRTLMNPTLATGARSLLPHVFDLFSQGRTTIDRTAGGLGIGLALVKTLVQLHGGSVSASSEGAGRGSEFVVTVPAMVPAAAEASAPSSAVRLPAATRSERVVVVDDNRDAAELVGEMLSAVGHEVSVAHDALQALSLITRVRPTVMVLDIGLPVMDGYELATRIREEFGEHAPRLIAVTGYGLDHDRARSREIGFEAHLVKPVDLEKLLAAVAAPSAKGQRDAEPAT